MIEPTKLEKSYFNVGTTYNIWCDEDYLPIAKKPLWVINSSFFRVDPKGRPRVKIVIEDDLGCQRTRNENRFVLLICVFSIEKRGNLWRIDM